VLSNLPPEGLLKAEGAHLIQVRPPPLLLSSLSTLLA
jgi:hypothetical protein